MVRMLSLCMCLLLVQSADAQLLRRVFGKSTAPQVSSSCPGGVCPTAAAQFNSSPVQSTILAPFKAVDYGRGHWSYPGSIDSHLEGTHGVSTQGMTREQKLDMHDALHEGRAQAPAPASYSYPAQSSYGAGSSGSRASYGSTGSRAVQSYGSSGSFAVGQYYKGELVTSIGDLTPVIEGSSSESKMVVGGIFDNVRARKAFRKVATEAARRKVESGEWSQEQFDNFTFAIHVPRIADEMRESLESKAMADGTFGAAQGINWENVERMIELVIKYLPMLLKLFADNQQVQPITINAAPYVSIKKETLPSVYELTFGSIAT